VRITLTPATEHDLRIEHEIKAAQEAGVDIVFVNRWGRRGRGVAAVFWQFWRYSRAQDQGGTQGVASIVGTVEDPSGALVTGATVTVKSLETGATAL